MGTEGQGNPEAMNSIAELHQPVMLERCIELLSPALTGKPAVLVDGTLGLGGHAEALLKTHPQLTVVGIDRDPRALELAQTRLTEFSDRFIPVEAIYDELADVLETLKIARVDGVLLDLGVSSMQLDQPERGFAYAQDAPLDMRMNPDVGFTAAELIARSDVDELTRIFRVYGEERFARPIAKAVVSSNPRPTRSGELNRLVQDVVPAAPGKSGGHPAKRIYQALRIAVNDELAALATAMPQAIAALKPGGRIVVMSYHSLEDGIVKAALNQAATSSTPVDFPIELPGSAPQLRVLTRGVDRAGEIELARNPRAAAARLRAAEKLEQ
jgi:16S rRNA (cytosine1402-N4)-methyltransferase